MSDSVKRIIANIVTLLVALGLFLIFLSGFISNYKENQFIKESKKNPDMVQNGVTIQIETDYQGRGKYKYNAIVSYEYKGETRKGRVLNVSKDTPLGTEYPIIVDDTGWMHQYNTQSLDFYYWFWLIACIAILVMFFWSGMDMLKMLRFKTRTRHSWHV